MDFSNIWTQFGVPFHLQNISYLLRSLVQGILCYDLFSFPTATTYLFISIVMVLSQSAPLVHHDSSAVESVIMYALDAARDHTSKSRATTVSHANQPRQQWNVIPFEGISVQFDKNNAHTIQTLER